MPNLLPIFCTILIAASLGCRDRTRGKSVSPSTTASQIVSPTQPGKVLTFRESVLFAYRPTAPDYPAELKKAGIEGDIQLILHLNKDGQIMKIEKGSGQDEFRSAAEAYARQCRFDVDPSQFPDMETVPFRLTLQFRLPTKARITPTGK